MDHEWTFDELDFVGAYEEIKDLHNELTDRYSFLVDEFCLVNSQENRHIYEYLGFRCTEVRTKLEPIQKIRQYLFNLKWGRNFNEKKSLEK